MAYLIKSLGPRNLAEIVMKSKISCSNSAAVACSRFARAARIKSLVPCCLGIILSSLVLYCPAPRAAPSPRDPTPLGPPAEVGGGLLGGGGG